MIYLFLLLSLPLMAQTEPPRRIQAVANPQKLEDFDHPNKGCPENSECDPIMGSMLSRWKDLLGKLSEDANKAKAPQMIELYRQKYGIPVEFYTYQNSQLGFKPLLYNSPCKEHNPKEADKKTLKGEAFVKSIAKDKAVVWRDQAQIEVPTAESLVVAQPVTVIDGANLTTFYLPLGDQPLLIKDKEVIVLREDEDLFYALKVGATGDWKVVPLDLSTLSTWEEKRETVSCPAIATEKANLRPKEFNVEFCKTVWDEDQKKTVIVKMYQGCSI